MTREEMDRAALEAYRNYEAKVTFLIEKNRVLEERLKMEEKIRRKERGVRPR